MKLKQPLLFSMTLIAVLACTPQVSQSTLVVPVALENMADGADTIIFGTIQSSYSYKEKNWILTGVKVDVHEYIKSAGPDQPPVIELKIMGGEFGGQRMMIDHAPRFFPGDEVVLFLDRQKDKYLVYGIYYGACYVETGKDGMSKQVVGPVFSNPKVRNIVTQKIQSNTLPPEGEKLESFVQRIKKLIGRK
jgi:hypothetical protein